jgi:hypothetical protein
MGVQIINKDVSVILQIIDKEKANISNVMGVGGWSGGGIDVTPDPTPDWGGDYTSANPVYSNTVQVLGINTPITLAINVTSNDGGTLTVGVNNTNEYGGTETTFTLDPTTFEVSNEQYVTFKWIGDNPGYAFGFYITNQSDSDTTLGGNVTLITDSGGP